MSDFPPLVLALTHHHDAWIVGGAANPEAKEFRDIDILVPLSHWQAAAALIPKNATVNSFGGFKCVCNDGYADIVVDVWPGELSWVMQHPKAKWAFHPRTGTRLARQ